MPKPAADRFPHEAANVPDELVPGDSWVLCDEHKAPLIAIPNGACFLASTTDPKTWRSYETAHRTFVDNEHIAGIGRVLRADEPYVGVDLDSCLDPDTGELSLWATTLVNRLGSYGEVSPSLTGVKVWVKAAGIDKAYKKPGLEVYPRGRYFVVTGVVLPGTNGVIREREDALQEILEEEFARVERPRGAYAGPRRALDLEGLLERSGIEVREVMSDGSAERKFGITCPWWTEHSDVDTSGTRVGQYPDGALFFRCEHAHCAHRGWIHFKHYARSLAYLGRPPLSEAPSFGGKGRLR